MVATREKTLAQDDLDRLISQHELASLYVDDGAAKKAAMLLSRVTTISENLLAQDHPFRLTSQYNPSMAYIANSQTEEATALLEHIVAMREMSGLNCPDSLCAVAYIYLEKGQAGKVYK